MPIWLVLILIGLANYNISSLLTREDGFTINGVPVFSYLRYRAGVRYNEYNEMYAENNLGMLFSCIKCMSRYPSIFMLFGYWLWGDSFIWFLTPLSLSTFVIIVTKLEK